MLLLCISNVFSPNSSLFSRRFLFPDHPEPKVLKSLTMMSKILVKIAGMIKSEHRGTKLLKKLLKYYEKRTKPETKSVSKKFSPFFFRISFISPCSIHYRALVQLQKYVLYLDERLSSKN